MIEVSNPAAMPAAVVIKMRLRPGVQQGFSAWHAKMCTIAAELPGFISAEVNAPLTPDAPVWRIIQHFRNSDQLRAWCLSDQYRRLLLEAESLVEKNGAAGLHEEEASEAHEDGTVTEVVTTYVKPDKVAEYTEWAAKIHKVEAQFPGYRGGFLQPPTSASHSYWTTLVRFATPEQLDAWLSSSERLQLLREHDALVSSWSHHRLPTSFAGWFPGDQTAGGAPPTWKQSMVVMLMIYPIVIAEMRFLGPLTSGLKPALGTFISNVISVGLLAWPFMPLGIGALKWWLLPVQGGDWRINAAGIWLVVTLYAVEIAALWDLVS